MHAFVKSVTYSNYFAGQFIHKLHLVYLVNDVLHHCVRKGADSLLKALEQVVPQMFCCASLAANDEDQNSKLQKLLTLWQSKNNYFERGLLETLESPQQVWNEYQNSLRMQYSMAISNVSSNIQSTYENYRSQHQAFVNHATHQIQQLEQQRQQIEQQIAAATVQVALRHILLCRLTYSVVCWVVVWLVLVCYALSGVCVVFMAVLSCTAIRACLDCGFFWLFWRTIYK